jgi:hypothetical protein
MQEVWGSNPHSSTGQKRNSKTQAASTAAKYRNGGRINCRTPVRTGHFPAYGCWQGLRFQALSGRRRAAQLEGFPVLWSCASCLTSLYGRVGATVPRLTLAVCADGQPALWRAVGSAVPVSYQRARARCALCAGRRPRPTAPEPRRTRPVRRKARVVCAVAQSAQPGRAAAKPLRGARKLSRSSSGESQRQAPGRSLRCWPGAGDGGSRSAERAPEHDRRGGQLVDRVLADP